MRVLVVTTWFPSTERPGIAPFNVAHARAIARKHDVHIVHAELGGTEQTHEDEYAGFQITRLPINPRRPLTTISSLNTLRRLARGADVLHSMAFSSLGVLAPLYPVIARRWIHTEHWSGVAYPEHLRKGCQLLSIMRYLLRLPRRVTAVSSTLANVATRFSRESAAVTPCVVAESLYSAPQPPWEPLKLISVGGLVPGKRPELAVDTLNELVRSGLEVYLTWIGDGPLRDVVHRRATDTGLSARIDLVGAIAPEDVAAHVRQANLFFLPTAFETFLLAGAEAIACGRPVILPNTGGFTDYVTHTNGIITENDSPQALANAIETAHDRFADMRADTLRSTVIPRFSEMTISEQFDDLYRQLEK